jgi:hypothetical protein
VPCSPHLVPLRSLRAPTFPFLALVLISHYYYTKCHIADDESVRPLPPMSPRSPAAITASFSSPHQSVTLSTAEQYQRLRIAESELAVEKKKGREMAAYIKQIQREVSEKAPVIQNQRHQYNRMLQSHQQLSTR